MQVSLFNLDIKMPSIHLQWDNRSETDSIWRILTIICVALHNLSFWAESLQLQRSPLCQLRHLWRAFHELQVQAPFLQVLQCGHYFLGQRKLIQAPHQWLCWVSLGVYAVHGQGAQEGSEESRVWKVTSIIHRGHGDSVATKTNGNWPDGRWDEVVAATRDIVIYNNTLFS